MFCFFLIIIVDFYEFINKMNILIINYYDYYYMIIIKKVKKNYIY